MGSIVLALILAELLVRLFFPQQLPTVREDIWVPKYGVGVEKAGNIDTTINSGEGSVRFITDEDGYRIGSIPAPADAPRVLVVGDSFVEATAIEYERSLSGLLESDLTESMGTPVRIVSAGVGGWNPNQYLYKTRMELERRAHELVIVFIYLGNDIVKRKTGPSQPRESRIKHIRMPRAFEYKEIVNAVVYPLYARLRYRSHVVVLIKSKVNVLLMRAGLTKRVFPNTLVRSHAESGLWDVTAGIASDIAAVAGENRVPVMFVILPADYQIDEKLGENFARGSSIDPSLIDLDQSSRVLAEKMKEMDLVVIDTTDILRQAFLDGQTPYAEFDRHLSESGHRIVVNRILPLVNSLLSDRITKKAATETATE
jgi:hypothetical protein